MKLRSTLLLLISMLLIAGAAMAAPVAAPAPASSVAAETPAPAPSLCIRNSTKAQQQVPDLNPASLSKSTLTCGACSVVGCRGAAYNSTCKIVGTKIYKCIAAYGNDCGDGTYQCQCWNGPLP